jgi:hypothetical protein
MSNFLDYFFILAFVGFIVWQFISGKVPGRGEPIFREETPGMFWIAVVAQMIFVIFLLVAKQLFPSAFP